MNSQGENARSADVHIKGTLPTLTDITDVFTLDPANASPPAADDAAQDIRPGTRIDNHYELIRELGRGGMGAVFLARDTKLGRRVAIKFLSNNKPEWNERFLVEARATARCVHENIVEIHDVDQYGDTPFMVLEYLNGQPLSTILTGVPLSADRAVELMAPVVRALVCAHARGIVHRDLKPDNVFITDSGTIKVLDFGIAKLLDSDEEPGSSLFSLKDGKPGLTTTDLTNKSSGVGTVPFMSPEQWGAAVVDHRSDIWAVGIILYIMVTGRHPLAPLSSERLASTAMLDQPMPRVADAGVDVHKELARIIDQCLVKDKARRMGSARELLAALEPLLPGRHAAGHSDRKCPYATGLSAFQEEDAGRFFGRSRDITALLGRVREQALIGVVGPSGVGKSSLVRAGVIAALKRSGEAWDAIAMRPGRSPLTALAQALVSFVASEEASRDEREEVRSVLVQRMRDEPGYLGAVLRSYARAKGHRVVLFVDQFDEIHTLVADPDERAAFTAGLLGMADDTSSPLRVIISVRSEFLDRVAEDRRFMSELSRGLCFLPPPDRAGLREALVRPAELAGYSFSSDDMVEHMLDALEHTPGALPLLQFTAGMLWDMRDKKRRMLTGESYARIGGVAGALAGHADAVLRSMPTGRQALARAVFRRLVTPERTRDIVALDELCTLAADPAELEQVVRYFVDARLLVMHQGDRANSALVEIVHDSLLTRWPALRRWLDENAEAGAFLADLRGAARQWHMRERSQGLLWRGDAVDRARRWHELCAAEMSEIERKYLDEVFALADRAARIKRWLIIGVIGFLLVLVVAAMVVLFAIRDAEQEARHEAERARQAERLAHEHNEQLRASEQRIREHLVELQNERNATGVAMHEAAVAKEATLMTREELMKALASARRAEAMAGEARDLARRESSRAQEAARQAERATEAANRAAVAEQKAREELERVLAEKDQRLRALIKEIGKMADGEL